MQYKVSATYIMCDMSQQLRWKNLLPSRV
jgi:hypothetical protein